MYYMYVCFLNTIIYLSLSIYSPRIPHRASTGYKRDSVNRALIICMLIWLENYVNLGARLNTILFIFFMHTSYIFHAYRVSVCKLDSNLWSVDVETDRRDSLLTNSIQNIGE